MLENIDLSQTFNIAIIGWSNTGKSSLMNALLKLSRKEALQVSKVKDEFFTTKNIIPYEIKEKVYLIDTPTLNQNYIQSQTMIEEFKKIQLILFVVTGYPPSYEKQLYDQKLVDAIKKYCHNNIWIVLNKIDQWDDYSSEYINNKVNQWKNLLKIDQIYLTSTRGYNPKSRTPFMDIRGVKALREDISKFIEENTLAKSPTITNNKADSIKETINDNVSIESVLEKYQKTAFKSYDINLKYSQDLATILASFKNNINKNNYSNFNNKHREINKLFNDIIQLIDNILTQDLEQLNNSLAIKKKHIKDYTIVLFGRTRAGKSTIREALTKGDGSTIGKGGQRTTRDVHEYRWNHLRLIDTPGIDAYKGEEDTEKANRSINEADMVLFLTSDDSVHPSEFEQMGRLIHIAKPFIVLLNVKGKLENEIQIKRFLAKPEKTFDEERLSGHHNHIKTYVKQHLAIEEVLIIDIHARAGFLSNQSESQEYKNELWQLSQLDKVYSIIAEDIYKNGHERRASTFFDGTKVLINEIRQQLNMIEQNIGDKISFFKTKEKEVKQIFTQQIKDSKINVENELKQLFRQFKQEIPSFIEYSIENQNAEKIWQEKNKKFSAKLEESIKILFKKSELELKEKFIEFEREYKYDTEHIEFYYQFENFYKVGFGDFVKNLSLLFSGIASVAFVAANWWNPAGWVVMGGWVATGVGVVAGLFSGSLKRQDKKEFQQKKETLKNQLIQDIDRQQTNLISDIHKKIETQFKDIEQEILSSFFLSRQELYSINNELLTIKVRIKDILNRLDIDKSLILQQSAKKNT